MPKQDISRVGLSRRYRSFCRDKRRTSMESHFQTAVRYINIPGEGAVTPELALQFYLAGKVDSKFFKEKIRPYLQ